MVNRSYTVYAGSEIIEEGMHDVEWADLRDYRTMLLDASDWRATGDREIGDEWREYRQLLRDLPQDWPGDNANDACDNFPTEPED